MSAHYVCPDCRARSHPLDSRAEAEALLAEHQRLFCRPAAGPVPPLPAAPDTVGLLARWRAR